MNNHKYFIKSDFGLLMQQIKFFTKRILSWIVPKQKKATPFWKSLFLSNGFTVFIFKMVFEICISISWLNFYPFFMFHKPFGTM